MAYLQELFSNLTMDAVRALGAERGLTKHRGRLEGRGELGRGSAFRIVLPVRQGPADGTH